MQEIDNADEKTGSSMGGLTLSKPTPILLATLTTEDLLSLVAAEMHRLQSLRDTLIQLLSRSEEAGLTE